MLKEIEKPLPTITEHLVTSNALNSCKSDCNLNVYDVAFKTDPDIVTDFAALAGITHEQALNFATSVFELIKKLLFDCNIIIIHNLGTFYVNGPHFDKDKNVVIGTKDIKAKFKPSATFKDAILAENKEYFEELLKNTKEKVS